jgi:hypothetical protein
MSEPVKKVDPLLQKAAQLRKKGVSWNELARILNRNPRTLRRWATERAEEWQQAEKQASTGESLENHLENATLEAIHILRTLLRSADEKIQRDAAKTLLDFCHSQPKVPQSQLSNLAQMVEGLNDHELLQLLEEATPNSPSRIELAPLTSSAESHLANDAATGMDHSSSSS